MISEPNNKMKDWLAFALSAFSLGAFLLFCLAWYRTEQMFRAHGVRLEMQKEAIDANTERMERDSIADRKAAADFFSMLERHQKMDHDLVLQLLKAREDIFVLQRTTVDMQKTMLVNQSKLLTALERLTAIQQKCFDGPDRKSPEQVLWTDRNGWREFKK